MAKTEKLGPKKPYSKPALIVYGTVREVTQMRGNMGNKDGGTVLGAMMSRL
jgi:hypothetical protein